MKPSKRNMEITRRIIEGETLAGVGSRLGLGIERIRSIYGQTIKHITGQRVPLSKARRIGFPFTYNELCRMLENQEYVGAFYKLSAKARTFLHWHLSVDDNFELIVTVERLLANHFKSFPNCGAKTAEEVIDHYVRIKQRTAKGEKQC